LSYIRTVGPAGPAAGKRANVGCQPVCPCPRRSGRGVEPHGCQITGTASTRPRDGRAPGSRTRSYPAPNGVDYRLPRTRWRRPESNRLVNACRARPLPLLPSP